VTSSTADVVNGRSIGRVKIACLVVALAGCGGGFSARTPGPASSPLAITTNGFYMSPLGAVYEATLTGSGGVTPYTWSIKSGQLPPGLALDASGGKIRGACSAAGRYTITVQLTDSSGQAIVKSFALTIVGVTLDSYGGLVNATSPAGASSFFRVEKSGNRWLLVSPAGNYMWMLSVQDINITAAGSSYTNAVKAKYGSNPLTWAKQTARRMLGWGFNTLGEESISNMFPLPTTEAGTGNPVQLPFIRALGTSQLALQSAYLVKDIVGGTNPTYYTGPRDHFPDVCDPNFKAAAQEVVEEMTQTFRQPLDVSPWLLGVTMDDADNLLGFKSASQSPNLGWITAVTAPTQTQNSDFNITYTDPTVYTKQAWAAFLENKYGSVGNLNAAWGSNYTSFGSDGGWGVGSGLLDEDGRHTGWIGKDYTTLKNTNPNTAADMDNFLEFGVAETYFSVQGDAIRSALPNHLVFAPDALWADARPEVLRAAGRHCDAIQILLPLDQSTSVAQAASELVGAYEAIAGYGTSCTDCKATPIYIYIDMTAHNDSPFAGIPSLGTVDFATQQARGTAYSAVATALFNSQASDGAFPIMGVNWWGWRDTDTQSEHANWGLVTDLDNAYDGQENRVATGSDAWGYLTGHEAHDFGDFISSVAIANWGLLKTLQAQFQPH